jgi:hypothetical protein
VTIPLVERRRAARHGRALAYWGVMLALYASLWLGSSLIPADWLHISMLFVHLASIIVGLGSAVFLEFNGLLWTIGRSTLADVRQTEQSVSALAWLGILGLFFSGAFLEPNLEDPLTVVKMAAVLVVAMNGVAMTRLTAELGRLPATIPFARVPRRVQLWCIWSALVSQAAWWTAVIIGMLNTAT